MKLLLLLFLTCTLSAWGQSEYLTDKDIRYYPDSVNLKNDYTSSQCRLDVYYPKDVKNFATIVWFHGGGLTGGSKEIPEELMGKGYAVVGVGYRLSPKVEGPACIADAAAALAWIFNNIGRYSGNNSLIFVSGHSAGAYLGMMITLDKKYLDKYRIDANRIAGLIPFSGQAITHFTIRAEKGIKGTQAIIDELAPLYYVRADAPPILLITGDREQELLGRYEENAYLARMLKLSGHTRTRLYELQGYNHNTMPIGGYALLLREVKELSNLILKRK